MQTNGQSIRKRGALLSPEVYGILQHGLSLTTVQVFAWNLPVSTRSLSLTFLRRHTLSCLHTPNMPNLKKGIRPTTRIRNGFVICSCVTWSILPLYPQLKFDLFRDLLRYRFKLTSMLTGEKVVHRIAWPYQAQAWRYLQRRIPKIFPSDYGIHPCSPQWNLWRHTFCR